MLCIHLVIFIILQPTCDILHTLYLGLWTHSIQWTGLTDCFPYTFTRCTYMQVPRAVNVISTRAPRGPGPVLQIYIYPVHNMPSSCACDIHTHLACVPRVCVCVCVCVCVRVCAAHVCGAVLVPYRCVTQRDH